MESSHRALRIRRIFCRLVIGLSLFGAADGHASAKTAKEWFALGINYVKEMRYADAIDAFNASFHLTPKVRILFNLAMCHKALGNDATAISLFRRYLSSDEGDAQVVEMPGEARAALAEIESRVGMLDLNTRPLKTAVVIGEEKPVTTPFKSKLPIAPGTYTITISARGFKDYKTTVEATEGETISLDVSLVPLEGDLRVECEETGLGTVFVDGIEMGVCPFDGAVDIGRHRVVVSAPGKVSFAADILIEGPAEKVLRVVLEPLSSPSKEAAPVVSNVPSALPETPPTSPMTADLGSRRAWPMAAGSALLTIGSAALVVGTTFNVKGARANARMAAIEASWDGAGSEQDADYIAYYKLYDRLPRYFTLTIAGYVTASVGIGMGIALLVFHSRRKASMKKRHDSVAIVPTPSGIAVAF